eukprot:CAMPEP_0119501176 /NCGR_PEP_ID=MMETSP1344-20130328/23097_1 /TAXON_ID=236787 /ORGANISM="Florenciella parvula, Strain CCMP2471" /LENGTH=141 /DNA_ID=CAMNT_0007537325 /DNA_START=52 /DNA_END=474 /DNA_ORIENTATION=-
MTSEPNVHERVRLVNRVLDVPHLRASLTCEATVVFFRSCMHALLHDQTPTALTNAMEDTLEAIRIAEAKGRYRKAWDFRGAAGKSLAGNERLDEALEVLKKHVDDAYDARAGGACAEWMEGCEHDPHKIAKLVDCEYQIAA